MKAVIRGPRPIWGEVRAPASKAYTHRALVASLLTRGKTAILNPLDCEDSKATLAGIGALGAHVTVRRNKIVSYGPDVPFPNSPINCGESGATLRFLAAAASVSSRQTILRAASGLAARPVQPLLEALNTLGARAIVDNNEQESELHIQGPLRGGEATLPGDVSSQFLSGLLLAAPLAQSDVAIRVDGKVESRPYVEMTIEVMRKHRIEIESTDREFFVRARQDYRPASHYVPGDFSSSSFLIAAAAIAGDEISIRGLSTQNLEPDKAIVDIASRIGLELKAREETIIVDRSNLRGFRFDASNNPDLVPALEVLASSAQGSSEITGVKRLRYKETDRLLTVPTELKKMGARIHTEYDRIKIENAGRLKGAVVNSHLDHRVAMACASAALGADGESVVENAQAVSKSYPDFFHDLTSLGAAINVE